MSHRWQLWSLVVALLLSGLATGGWAVFSGEGSPRGHIAARYARMPGSDIGTQARAYSTRLAPSQVTDDLTGAWKPAARHVDATGVYLRYAVDTVAIRPEAGGGTLILVERTATAYPRYQAQLDASEWSER